MSESFDQLLNVLNDLTIRISARDRSSAAPWEIVAYETTLENVNRYHSMLKSALQNGDVERQSQAACAASGLRKGVLELGLLDHERDQDLIGLIDLISSLATRLCLD